MLTVRCADESLTQRQENRFRFLLTKLKIGSLYPSLSSVAALDPSGRPAIVKHVPVMFFKKRTPFSPPALFSPRSSLGGGQPCAAPPSAVAAIMDQVHHQVQHDEYAAGACVQPLPLSCFECIGVCGDTQSPAPFPPLWNDGAVLPSPSDSGDCSRHTAIPRQRFGQQRRGE